MKLLFKITNKLLSSVRADLVRSHEFAAERVGFLSCRFGALSNDGLVILACAYHPIEDADYVENQGYGALMGSEAIRKALYYTYRHSVGMFHIHIHGHYGGPRFSRIDENEARKFVPHFFHARNTAPHGAIILSLDSACGFCWLPGAIQSAGLVAQATLCFDMEHALQYR
ncbi:MAG: hypothetical protein ACKVRP_03140 [Bacteroidota bacterium]